MRFHIPFEHGAWWAFFSTLLGGAAYALALGSPPVAVLALGLGISGGFLAQDWAQALVGAVMGRRSQAVSQWQAWQGWALAAASLTCLAVTLSVVGHAGAWGLFVGILSLAYAVSLERRVTQSGRGRSSLPFASVLLAFPALAMAAVPHGFSLGALQFFFWPALYYPAVTLAAQAYIRGLPQGWRYSGPWLLAALVAAALYAHAWVAAGAVTALAVMLSRQLQERWRRQAVGMPAGENIRSFGKRQAAWGVGLTLLWILEFLKGPW